MMMTTIIKIETGLFDSLYNLEDELSYQVCVNPSE